MQKTSINNGIFLGIALVIATYVLYLANTRMFFNAKGFVLFTIFLLITIKSGFDARRANGGFIEFKQAFVNMFITGAIGYFLATIGEYILFNIVDTDLVELQKEISIEAIEEMSGMFGGEEMQEALEEEIDKIEGKDLAGASSMLLAFFIRLIIPIALFSAIIAFFIKRKGDPIDHLDDKPDQGYMVNN